MCPVIFRAVINLLKQYSHSIHDPRIQPPYFGLKHACVVEVSKEKQAILKLRDLGLKFQKQWLLALTTYVA